jgi:hypothetical protein
VGEDEGDREWLERRGRNKRKKRFETARSDVHILAELGCAMIKCY